MYPFIILYALFFIKHKNLWIKNFPAEVCHFNTQKYKSLFSQGRSSFQVKHKLR